MDGLDLLDLGVTIVRTEIHPESLLISHIHGGDQFGGWRRKFP